MSDRKSLFIVSNSPSDAHAMAAAVENMGVTPAVFLVGLPVDGFEDGCFVQSVNPGSYISLKAALVAAENKTGKPLGAVFSWVPGMTPLRPLDIADHGEIASFAEMEALVPVQCLRELLAVLGDAGTMVVSIPATMVHDENRPLDSAAYEWTKATTEAFFRISTETVPVLGVLDSSESRQSLAEFLSRLAVEPSRKVSGRWIRFSGKPGLFNLM